MVDINEQLSLLIETLKEEIRQPHWDVENDPEFCVIDWCGGNYDDAYEGGINVGRAQLARELLEKFIN